MLKRVDIVGNPNLGVFITATDDVAIVPYNLLDEKVDIIKETLEVDVIKSSIAGSSLIGSLTVANSNGIVVSPHVLDREVKQLEDLGLKVATIPGRYTAVGNIVAANDKGAIASPFLDQEAIEVIEETLDVNVQTSHIVGSDIIGSLIKVTNKGFLISTNALQSEVNFAREVFGVEGDIGTVGRGISLVGTKIYRVKGTFVMGDEYHDFTKEYKATSESDIEQKIYERFGSKHGINRNQISIESIEEIAPEDVLDPIVKEIL